MGAPEATTIAAILRQGLAAGQHPLVTITSNSMAPLLKAGDRAMVRQVDWRSLRPGEIVVVETPGILLTHRFYGTIDGPDGPWMVLRGDRPLTYDRPVPADRLVGRVVARQRRRLISLESGAGGWLNRHLARLARLELRLLRRPAPMVADAPAEGPRPIPPAGRAARRALYLWALVVTVALRGATALREDD